MKYSFVISVIAAMALAQEETLVENTTAAVVEEEPSFAEKLFELNADG